MVDRFIDHLGYQGALQQLSKLAGFRELPPTIDEFIDNTDFLGDFLGCSPHQGGLYPTWREELNYIYPSPMSSPFTEIACTGSIGIGKSTVCVVGICYDIMKLLHMQNPHAVFGLGKDTSLQAAFINTTKEQSEEVLFGKFMAYMNSSPYFIRERAKVVAFDKRRKKDFLPHKIKYVIGSRPNDVLGRGVFTGVMSEINFMNERMKDQAYLTYTQLRDRIITRFGMRGSGYLMPGRIWLDSSKKDESGFLEQHIKALYDDPKGHVVIHSIWEVKERAGIADYSGEKFKIFIGSQNMDPFIPEGPGAFLNIPETLLIDVPVELREEFERNLTGSLQNLAGISTWGSQRFLSYEQLINEALCLDLDNIVQKPVIALDFIDDDDKLINYINVQNLPREKPYFIHFDLAYKKDRTGVAMTRCVGDVSVTRRSDNPMQKNVMSRDPIFETPLALAVVPRPGSEVPLSKMRDFIVDLVRQGIPIAGVTADGFQSREIIQQAVKMNLMGELLSVDKPRDRYDYLKDVINERRIRCVNHPILKDEWINLRDEGDKIDHPKSDGRIKNAVDSKDISDAVCGSVYNCGQKSIGNKSTTAMTEYADYLSKAKVEATFAQKMFEQAKKSKKRGSGGGFGKLGQ